MPATAEQDFMAIAPGIGCVKPEDRNRGYDKLDWEPGEGGLSGALDVKPSGGNDAMQAFLAGVAAGADPQELAKGLMGPDSSSTRKRGR